MTLNELIERLNWLKEDGVDGDTVISNIRPFMVEFGDFVGHLKGEK